MTGHCGKQMSMAEKSFKWLEISMNVCKWQNNLEMSGNGWKWLEIIGNLWKWLGMVGDVQELLENPQKAGYGFNGFLMQTQPLSEANPPTSHQHNFWINHLIYKLLVVGTYQLQPYRLESPSQILKEVDESESW